MPCMPSAYFGSPRESVCRCETYSRCPVTAEAAGSRPVVLAIPSTRVRRDSPKPLGAQKASKRKPIGPAKREFAKIALQKMNWLLSELPDSHDMLQIPQDRLLPTKMGTQQAPNQDWFQLVSTSESAHIADAPVGRRCF